jgi:hypothetical protein
VGSGRAVAAAAAAEGGSEAGREGSGGGWMDSRATVAEISGAFLDAAFLFSFVLLWALEKTKKEKKKQEKEEDLD